VNPIEASITRAAARTARTAATKINGPISPRTRQRNSAKGIGKRGNPNPAGEPEPVQRAGHEADDPRQRRVGPGRVGRLPAISNVKARAVPAVSPR
jgi:hypothetical protein